MKRARFIYNPSSGREEVKKHLYEILDVLESYGLETSTYQTKKSGDATEAAIEAAERGFDVIIAAGGDGTLYEVINGLSPLEKRPALGVIPAGTTNDFARALAIPRDFREAAKIIGEQQSMAIDIGKYNDQHFINIAAGGILTELTYEVPSKLKTVLGQLAYYVRGIEKLPYLKPIHITLESDERTIEEEVMMFLIANSNSVGGFEKLAPQADLSDGLFDVIVLKETNVAEFVRVASLAKRGEHLSDDSIIYFKAKKVKVISHHKDSVSINLDGELGGTLPGEFEVLPKHINVFVKRNG